MIVHGGRPPDRRRGRHAGGLVGIYIAIAMIFHSGRTQRHQPRAGTNSCSCGWHVAGPVSISMANSMVLHGGRPTGRQQAGEAGMLAALWAFLLQQQ